MRSRVDVPIPDLDSDLSLLIAFGNIERSVRVMMGGSRRGDSGSGKEQEDHELFI